MFAPALNAFLMRDAKEPAAEFSILAQAADVFDGGDESFLHQVEARLFFAREFKKHKRKAAIGIAGRARPKPPDLRRGLAAQAVVRVRPLPAFSPSRMREARKGSTDSEIFAGFPAGYPPNDLFGFILTHFQDCKFACKTAK
jgi:hypothetical protein